jgi:uncharacterized membrane protein YdjX (TVP38/TMEM64 family)/Fe-S oxidoreductase
VSGFQETCTGCGICKHECPFLSEFGTPDEILARRQEVSFYCTSCRRCDSACPLNLSPSAAFFETKTQLIREGKVPQPVQKALNGARGFAKAGHGFPFSFYSKTETVFWPGCGLAANNPRLVRRIQAMLSRELQQPVGLILDCCFDPAFTIGDSDTTLAALREINKKLLDGGAKKIITGCLNCHKLLSAHLQELEVVFILQVFPAGAFGKQGRKPMYLHHPCPSSHWDGIRNAARDTVSRIYPSDLSPATDHHAASVPLCCGSGGSLTSISPERANRFLDEILRQTEGKTIVTYCTGCQNRFLQKGMEALHLLECLEGEQPRRTVPSPLRQWANRLVLAARARLNISKLIILSIIALLIAGGFYLNSRHIFSAEALTALLARYPVASPLIFLCIYAIAPSLFLPSIPITLAAGFFWGPVWGVIFSIVGATLGSCLPFFLSRYLFQDAIKARVPEERWNWLQDKVAHHGWKAVAFTRLVPVFPFTVLNYLFGLTPIPFFQYLWSTFIFMLPACIAFVAFGSSLGELLLRGNIRGVITGIVIAVCAFLIPLALRPFFRKIGDDKAQKPDETRQERR